jgi:hypothetical protein
VAVTAVYVWTEADNLCNFQQPLSATQYAESSVVKK